MNSPKIVAGLLAVSLLLCLTGCMGFSSSQKSTIAPASDFSLIVNPTSATIAKGASTSLNARVVAQGSFTGTVQLSVLGMPSGSIATLSSSTVAGSGDPTISVATSKDVAAGNYTVTVTGTSGTLVHSTNFSLAVISTTTTPDFSLSATPNLQTFSVGREHEFCGKCGGAERI